VIIFSKACSNASSLSSQPSLRAVPKGKHPKNERRDRYPIFLRGGFAGFGLARRSYPGLVAQATSFPGLTERRCSPGRSSERSTARPFKGGGRIAGRELSLSL